MPFAWPFALVFWGVFVWAFVPEVRIIRRASRSEGAKNDPSLRVILRGQLAAFFIAFPLASVNSLRFPGGHPALPFWIGVGMMVGGSLLRRHCFRMLGESFTGEVRASADQAVVSTGAYAILRHPSYTAGILMHTGIGVALGSWASALLLLGASLAVYVVRMRVEEAMLLDTIGEPYARFMRTRKRLIPFVY